MKTHFFTKPVQSYRCRFCNANFVFNNQLHKHLRIIYNKSKSSIKIVIVINFELVNKFIIIISTTKAFLLKTFHVLKVMYSNITNVTIKEYVFRTSLRYNIDKVSFNKTKLRALFRHGIYHKSYRSKVLI